MSGLTCQQARSLFDAQLNRELGDDLSTEIAAHCLRCPSCRHELALLEVAGRVIRAEHDEPSLPDDFTDRLVACVRKQPAPPIPFYRRARVLWTAGPALAAACLLLVVGLWPEQPENRVLGTQETRAETRARMGPEPPDVSLDEATLALQERFQDGASAARNALHSLGEASKRTLRATLQAVWPDAGSIGPLMEGLPRPTDEPPPGVPGVGDVEDL
jgi:hypothetical protein